MEPVTNAGGKTHSLARYTRSVIDENGRDPQDEHRCRRTSECVEKRPIGSRRLSHIITTIIELSRPKKVL
jgi:hypothetical protein